MYRVTKFIESFTNNTQSMVGIAFGACLGFTLSISEIKNKIKTACNDIGEYNML